MKNLVLFFILNGVILYPQLSAQSATDEKDIHNFARTFMTAYNQQDAASLQKMYTTDAVRIDKEGKKIEGAEQIMAHHAKEMRENNVTLLIRQERFGWSDAQHAFVAQGTYEVYGKSYVYDMDIQETGSYANTMLKKDGEWKIAQSVLMPVEASSSSNNAAIVKGLYEAFAVGDIPSVLAGLHPKVVWNEAEGNSLADGNPYIGPDAVLEGVFARIGAEYEYFRLKNIELHEMANGKVLATLRYDAKLKRNGATIDAQAAHLWTLSEDEVTAFQQYVDTKQLAEAEAK